MRRALCAAVLVATALAAVPAEPAAAGGGDEAYLVDRINDLRTRRGLPPLAVHGQLVALARSWASTMAQQGDIFHRSDLSRGAPANWIHLGENVGVGPSAEWLHQALVDSPSHHANMVNPRYQYVGVGVVRHDGSLWLAQEFMAVATPAVEGVQHVRRDRPPAAPPVRAAPSALAAAPPPAPEPWVYRPSHRYYVRRL